MNSSAVTISELHTEPTVASCAVSEQVQEDLKMNTVIAYIEMNVVLSQSGQQNSVCMVCLFFVVQTKLESKVEFYPHICTNPVQNMC